MTPSQRLAQLEAFLEQDPSNAALLADAVQAAVEAGLPARGRTLLARTSAPAEGAAQHAHLDATLLLAEGRYDEARRVLLDLQATGVDAAAVSFNLGYASLRAGDATGAAAVLRPLLERPDAPDTTLAYLMRAEHHAGRAEAAIAAWNAAPARLRTPEATAVSSLVHLDLDQLDAARELADRALAAGSVAVEALVARATVAVSDNDEIRANALLDRARQTRPGDGRVLSAVGAARMARGDISGAEAAFRQSLAAMPGHVGSWHALAWCQIVAGDLDGARHSFGTALELDRNFGETHGGLAVVDALQGRLEAAQSGIERARRLGAGGLSYPYAQAVLSGEARDPERCVGSRSGCSKGGKGRRRARWSTGWAPDAHWPRAVSRPGLISRCISMAYGDVPRSGVSRQPGQAEESHAQRATADSRVDTVSVSVCSPSSCM